MIRHSSRCSAGWRSTSKHTEKHQCDRSFFFRLGQKIFHLPNANRRRNRVQITLFWSVLVDGLLKLNGWKQTENQSYFFTIGFPLIFAHNISGRLGKGARCMREKRTTKQKWMMWKFWSGSNDIRWIFFCIVPINAKYYSDSVAIIPIRGYITETLRWSVKIIYSLQLLSARFCAWYWCDWWKNGKQDLNVQKIKIFQIAWFNIWWSWGFLFITISLWIFS